MHRRPHSTGLQRHLEWHNTMPRRRSTDGEAQHRPLRLSCGLAQGVTCLALRAMLDSRQQANHVLQYQPRNALRSKAVHILQPSTSLRQLSACHRHCSNVATAMQDKLAVAVLKYCCMCQLLLQQALQQQCRTSWQLLCLNTAACARCCCIVKSILYCKVLYTLNARKAVSLASYA